MDISYEDRQKIMDEAVVEVHSANSEFLEAYKMPLKAFRGMYQVHILFNMIDSLVDKKIESIINQRIQEFLDEENGKNRRQK